MEVGDGAITIGSGLVDTGVLPPSGIATVVWTATLIGTTTLIGATDIALNVMRAFRGSTVAANG